MVWLDRRGVKDSTGVHTFRVGTIKRDFKSFVEQYRP